MESAKLIFADGTILGAADPQSREEFSKSKPEFVKRLLEIRDSVRADEELSNHIEKKYRIKMLLV